MIKYSLESTVCFSQHKRRKEKLISHKNDEDRQDKNDNLLHFNDSFLIINIGNSDIYCPRIIDKPQTQNKKAPASFASLEYLYLAELSRILP
jgi:hypothetical protein